jgi:hydroxymethylpyrimidine/phosphomethylpyrimidine kinase
MGKKYSERYPVVMTIAGSDSSAGAGIQADLKTISALGGYGLTAITAITAQNTRGVIGIQPVSLDMIEKQLNALISDLPIYSIKTGMLHSIEVINLVANFINESQIKDFVLDPVMVATSGDKLIFEDTVKTLIDRLFPLAKIITPNLGEAETILDRKITDVDELKKAAIDLLEFGPEAVLLKGAHLNIDDKVYDVMVQKSNVTPIILTTERINTVNVHGTGCTLSAALATFLAHGHKIEPAIFNAKHYVTQVIIASQALELGKGNGPLNHFI